MLTGAKIAQEHCTPIPFSGIWMPNYGFSGWFFWRKGRKPNLSALLRYSTFACLDLSGRALPSDEVIGWPWAAHHNFDPRQVPSCHLVAVLVFLYFFVVDQVGDVNQHTAGINLAAADILVKRGENLLDLDGESAGLGLALPLPHRFFPQLAEVFAADGGRKFDLFNVLASGA